MLIINADDVGRTVAATNNSLTCYEQGRISSASAMVFMSDSQRAAESVMAAGMDIGLHLNLDLPFDSQGTPPQLRERQARIARYLRIGKWPQIVYNPFLRNDIDYVFKAQCEEFRRLFGVAPARVDGHHHRHLCLNMLIDHPVLYGKALRRNFTFGPGEKDIINRTYRRIVDGWLARRYYCTDAFYSIEPIGDTARLSRIVSQARDLVVELMVHPAVNEQFEYLMSDHFRDLILTVTKGDYRAMVLARAR